MKMKKFFNLTASTKRVNGEAMGKTKRYIIDGEVDLIRVKRGHKEHRSGCGTHKDKRRKTRQKQKQEYLER